MVTGSPAAVIVPVRGDFVVFAATEYLTWPFPVPLAPDVIVIHDVVVDAVHAQFGADAVTLNCPVPPPTFTDCVVAESVKVHGGGAPACVTVTVWPAAAIVPVRDEVELFAAAEYPTCPLPVPLVPDVIVIHGVVVDAVHAQVGADVVTPNWPGPPAAGTDCVVAESVKLHGGDVPAWVTVTVWPAIVSVPDRADDVVFARMLNCTCALPAPVAALFNEIQETFDVAVQAHPAEDAVTATALVEGAAATDTASGAAVNAHEDVAVAASVTVNVCPPTDSLPMRWAVEALGATVN
jgi:hypothetical protein